MVIKDHRLLCAPIFLQINGFESLVPSVVFRLEDIAVWVADNKISRDLLREVFYSLLYEDEYSEELLLKLSRAVGALV